MFPPGIVWCGLDEAGRLAGRSIALAEQVSSEVGTSYASLAMLNHDDEDLSQAVSARIRLARVQSALASRQAESVRVQVNGIRARVLEHGIRAVVDCPPQNLVIDLPEPPQIFDEGRL